MADIGNTTSSKLDMRAAGTGLTGNLQIIPGSAQIFPTKPNYADVVRTLAAKKFSRAFAAQQASAPQPNADPFGLSGQPITTIYNGAARGQYTYRMAPPVSSSSEPQNGPDEFILGGTPQELGHTRPELVAMVRSGSFPLPTGPRLAKDMAVESDTHGAPAYTGYRHPTRPPQIQFGRDGGPQPSGVKDGPVG